ncbi:MAG: hypothetical protein WAK10_00345 [Methanoregula sp.]
MQILQMGKTCGGEGTMRDIMEALLAGGNEMDLWDEKRYVKEEQKIRNLFLNDPEFMKFIARVRMLKINNTPKMAIL